MQPKHHVSYNDVIVLYKCILGLSHIETLLGAGVDVFFAGFCSAVGENEQR